LLIVLGLLVLTLYEKGTEADCGARGCDGNGVIVITIA
jgi:hypothetical protein